MGELSRVLERLRDQFTPPPDGFERLVALRATKRRRQRLTALTTALGLGVAGVLVAVNAFDGSSRQPPVGDPGDRSSHITFVRDGELWTVPSDGGAETRLAIDVGGAVNGVAWSADGTRMAVSIEVNPGTEGGQFRLYVADADGSNARRLTEGVSDRFPTWSPDGARIAFTRDLSDGNQELFVVNADGSDEVQLTDTDGANLQPTWSPDGARIAFTSTRDGNGNGNSEIYAMNADGSDPRRLTHDAGWDAAPDWSSTGDIAYTSDGPEPGIYVVDAESPTSELLLADPDPFNLFVSWSPDGRTLALASRRDDDVPTLFLLDVETGELTRLADGDLLWGPAWRLAPVASEPNPTETIRGEVSETLSVGKDPRSVAYGAGSVWVAVSNNDGTFGGRILRIDPATNEIVAEIPVETIPTWEVGGGAMVVNGDSLWVTGGVEAPGNFESPGGGADTAVVRIDVATNEVVDTFTLGGTVGADLRFLEGDLWLLVFGDETVDHRMEVVRTDAQTGEVIARIALTTSWAHRIIPVGGRIVVIEGGDRAVNIGGQMTSVDPVTNRVAASADIPSPFSPHGPVHWRGELWASLDDGFARFDPATGELVDRSQDLDPSKFAIHSGFIEADDRGIWFLGYDGVEGSGPVRLALFDPGTDAVTELVTLGEGNPVAMAVAPDSVWILNYEGTLTKVDLNQG